MIRFVRTTLLPVVAFAGLGSMNPLTRWDPGSAFLLRHGPLLTALVFVPLAWYGYVVRPGRPAIGRAALAGATLGFLISALPVATSFAWFAATHGQSNPGLGALLRIFDFYFIGVGLFVCAPVGVLLGVLLAFIQQHGLLELTDEPEARHGRMQRALTGAMWTILASPVVALIALALFRVFEVFPRAGYADTVAWTLLVAVPVVATLIARRRDPAAGTARDCG